MNIFKNYSFQVFLLIILLLVVFIFALSVGRYSISLHKVFSILFDNLFQVEQSWSSIEEKVIEQIRLPRILVAGICGALLSLSGVALQGIFRNALVGPQIIGVSSGSAFGGVIAMLFMLPSLFIPIFSFIFGLFAILITIFIAKVSGSKNILSLILGGIVSSAFFTSLVSLVKYTADPNETLPTIVYWLLGSYNKTNYIDVLYVFIPLITVGVLLYKMRYLLNILSFGEEEANALGVSVNLCRWFILLSCTVLISATVSVSGIVGWVGLIIPHLARMITGANHSRLLLFALLIGAIYMIIVDTIARTGSYGEIPIGIITSFIGAPLFAWLIYYTKLKGWKND